MKTPKMEPKETPLQKETRLFHEAVNGLIPLDGIDMLDHIHVSLDHAVLDAYKWPHNLTSEQIVEHLLALNIARAS
jgi:hypothetical protein